MTPIGWPGLSGYFEIRGMFGRVYVGVYLMHNASFHQGLHCLGRGQV